MKSLSLRQKALIGCALILCLTRVLLWQSPQPPILSSPKTAAAQKAEIKSSIKTDLPPIQLINPGSGSVELFAADCTPNSAVLKTQQKQKEETFV